MLKMNEYPITLGILDFYLKYPNSLPFATLWCVRVVTSNRMDGMKLFVL